MRKLIFLTIISIFVFVPLSVFASNLKQYYVVAEFSSDYKIIVEDSWGDKYLVEYGIGCLSMWRYENKTIYIDVSGWLDGIGDEIYLFDSTTRVKFGMLKS